VCLIGAVTTSEYRLAPPVVVRMMAVVLAVAGLVVLVAAALVALLSWSGGVLSVVVAGTAAVVVALLTTLFVLSRRTAVVRLDETGYAVRWVRGAGVTDARWKDVEDVVADTVAGSRCVVVRHRDGRTTTIPVTILDRPAEAFVQDLQQHLNRGHGYRPLR
jgi:hypothetical protein